MAYEKLILLAPCHGLEDFPLYHSGEDAASLLACWTSLWHPLFLDSAAELPHIIRCDYPSEDIDNALLLLPKPCESELDPELPAEAEAKNAKLIRAQQKRSDILGEALQRYGESASKLDADLVRDFLAFGFAFLQVEVLTQQMRYASSIDQTRIARDIKEAARALIDGNHALCRDKLTVCHDALADERSHYYPVEVYLVDLTLLATAESTLGRALDRQLKSLVPQNMLASGQTVEKLAEFNPEALTAIRQRIAAGNIGLGGGEYEELPLPLLSPVATKEQLALGRETYQRLLEQPPCCFARRKNGQFPELANILKHAGFERALHLKFDEGQMPVSPHGKTTWTVGEQELLACFARAPLDASLHETFLNLPTHLSETMDSDHVATQMFIHWPGHVAPWYDDLRRCGRYGTALGRFVTLGDYFDEATESTTSSFKAADYVYPFLKQSIQQTGANDLIATTTQYWKQEIADSSARGLAAIASCLGTDVSNIETGLGLQQRAGVRTIVNPYSFPRRVAIVGDSPGSGEAVYASGRQQSGKAVTLVDVPAMGFASIDYGKSATTGELDIVDELTLRNEFLQATIDPVTGALRSLKDYKSRTTRLSQQVAFRITLPKTGQPWVDSKAPVAYSVMAADSVEVTDNGQVTGEVTARGRLLALNGELVGEFTQRYRVTRGSRVVDVSIELTTVPEVLLEDPWDSYYACRFAFGDESAILRAGSHLQTHDVSRRRFEAPLFVDIDCGDRHTAILTAGLPCHRRVTDSQLDTILAVHGGSTTSSHRIGIGVDLPVPMRTAVDFIASGEPPCEFDGKPAADTGWFFHLDARNCIVPSWKPLDDNAGVLLTLVETDHRKSTVRIHSFKPWREGQIVNATGETIEALKIVEGVAEFDCHPGGFAELRLLW